MTNRNSYIILFVLTQGIPPDLKLIGELYFPLHEDKYAIYGMSRQWLSQRGEQFARPRVDARGALVGIVLQGGDEERARGVRERVRADGLA